MMRNVIIADDHPVVFRGLKEILRENFGGVVVDGAGTGRELIEKIKRNDYDLVLLDICLPDANGLDVLSDLRKRRPKLPVLVISMYPEELYAVRAIRTGAQGYLTKQSAPDELVGAVRKILAGKRYVNPAFAVRMVVDFESDIVKPAHERLSNREFQVMRMFGSGKSIKDIADELNLSINSIRTYRARIMDKIGVKGTQGLIHYALTHGLIEYRGE
jgi:DNA-binding NarL/FixJ family response regulator